MAEYAFDVKLWATVRVTADSLEAAQAAIRAELDCLDIGAEIRAENGATIKLTEASPEGDGDLIEIDGEAV